MLAADHQRQKCFDEVETIELKSLKHLAKASKVLTKPDNEIFNYIYNT